MHNFLSSYENKVLIVFQILNINFNFDFLGLDNVYF
jgi:hypothetical protein